MFGRGAGQRLRIGQDLLLGVGQRMGGAANDVAQREGVCRQPRLGGDEPFNRRSADAQDLGLHVRRLRAELGVELLHLLLHPLRLAQPRVLVRRHARVDVEAGELLVEPGPQVERVGERLRRGSQPARERRDLRHLRLDPGLRGAPCGDVRKDLGEVPRVFRLNPGAVAFLFGQQHNLASL